MSYKFTAVKDIELDQTDQIFDIQFHPTKPNILAVSTIEGDVHLLDIDAERRSVAMSLEKHHNGSPIRKIRFASDELLISVSKTIKIYDLNKCKVIRKIKHNGTKIYSLLVIDPYLFCIGDDEGRFRAWDYRVDRGVYMDMKECEDFISDLDIDRGKRTVVASSGEGTLSAFNIRSRKLEEPQSELFDAGFQCVRYLHEKPKVIVGAEDGAINIFNCNEWGNISDRFPVRETTTRSDGGCSIDSLEVFDKTTCAVGSSDGKLRAVNILPNEILCDICEHKSSVEGLTVNRENQLIASVDSNTVKINKYEETERDAKTSNRSDFFSGLEED